MGVIHQETLSKKSLTSEHSDLSPFVESSTACVDRKSPRDRLETALDAIFAEPIDPQHNRDAVESKLFAIGSESYVVGSHEFYLGYAIKNRMLYCLDAGHFHPTEAIADKISAIMQWVPIFDASINRIAA